MDSGAAAKDEHDVEGRSDARGRTSREGEPSDRELGRRARDGDRQAFGDLYRRYAPLVHGVLIAHAPWREVHDLLQDVFVLALRSIERLEEPDRIGPWILAIARNRARDRHKRGARELDGDAMPEPVAAREVDDDEEEARVVLDAIRELPESYRETLVLRLVEGLSGPEIARRTGLTHGSVRVNLFRGMKLLRERLERNRLDRERRRNSS